MHSVATNGTSAALLEVRYDVSLLDEVHDQIMAGQVDEGMTGLLPLLQTMRLQAGEPDWQAFVRECLRHPLRAVLHQDPFTHRAFTKPRGYAGDAVLLDFIYGREEGWPVLAGTSELGERIFQFTTNSSACEGVRARRGFIADYLDYLAVQTSRPHVLSVACGHLREALLTAAIKRRKFGRFCALDADALSLQEIQRCYGAWGIEPVHGNVRQMLTQKVALGSFDFIYSMGLFDYLTLTTAQRLTSVLFRMLRPRGRLLVANFLPAILDVGYMETYMDWKLIYRARVEVLELSAEIPQAEIHDIRLFAEDNQNILFLEITRR
jgi:SAM-dependent methyltransferase